MESLLRAHSPICLTVVKLCILPVGIPGGPTAESPTCPTGSNICQTNRGEQAEIGPSRQCDRTRNPRVSIGYPAIVTNWPDDPNLAHNPKVAGSNPAPATHRRRETRRQDLSRVEHAVQHALAV